MSIFICRSLSKWSIAICVLALLSACKGAALRPVPEDTPIEIAYEWGNIIFSGEATAGPLEILSVDLTFEEGRRGMVVALESKLKANVRIHFAGQGRLHAVWEVDGHPVLPLMTPMHSGDTLTFSQQGKTVFPTSQVGTHRITLKIQEPGTRFASPILTYAVVEEPPPLFFPSTTQGVLPTLKVTTEGLAMTGLGEGPSPVKKKASRETTTDGLTMTGLKRPLPPPAVKAALSKIVRTERLTLTGLRIEAISPKALVPQEITTHSMRMTGTRK